MQSLSTTFDSEQVYMLMLSYITDLWLNHLFYPVSSIRSVKSWLSGTFRMDALCWQHVATLLWMISRYTSVHFTTVVYYREYFFLVNTMARECPV